MFSIRGVEQLSRGLIRQWIDPAELRCVLPVPPQQPAWLTASPGIVCRATENIEHAAILMNPAQGAQPLVHGLGILAAEIGRAAESQIPKVLGKAWADTRNLHELYQGIGVLPHPPRLG